MECALAQPTAGSGSLRVVVNIVGEPAHGLLAESRFVDRPFLPGGEHNLYELAFAAAKCGYEVELRGWLDRAAFDRLSYGAGVAPSVGLPARRPTSDDLVVVPEGWRDPLEYARLFLSAARLALFVLAPPGLFGWPFTKPGWTPPDPLTVSPDDLATPEAFRAIDRLGISMLTHSPGIVEAAESTGVPCALIGTGRPASPAPSQRPAQTVDVAALLANRWAPLVREIMPDLDGLAVDLIEETTNEEVLTRLARSRILLWPSRVEGHATVPWEARTVGCVPVALSTNRFAVGLSDEAGAVLVDEVRELAPAIRALLADPPRLRELSVRAVRTARTESDWDTYVGRIGDFLSTMFRGGPECDARSGMGAALSAWQDVRATQAQERLEEITAEERRVRADRDRLVRELDALRSDRDRLVRELDALHSNRGVRIALRLRELGLRGGP